MPLPRETGRVPIPKKEREALDLWPGGPLDAEIEGRVVRLRPVRMASRWPPPGQPSG